MRRLLLLSLLTASFSWAQLVQVHVNRPHPAGSPPAGITFHNVNSERVVNANSGETTPITINSTLTNGCIVATMAMYDGADANITGATFDGNAMTLLASHNIDFFGEYRVFVFFFAVGSFGASTVNVAMTSSSQLDDYNIGIMAYNGCHQTVQDGTATDASGTSALAAATVSSATGELVVGVVIKGDSTGAPNSGETERWDTGTGSADTGWGGEEAGAASVAFEVALAASETWCMTAVPIKPAP